MPPAGKTLGTVDGKTRLARRSKRRRPRFVRSGEIPEGEYFTMHASRVTERPEEQIVSGPYSLIAARLD